MCDLSHINVDDDLDEQPVQDLALNVDNVFQVDECDAFVSDVDEAPTAQTMFMANLSSANLVYDEAGPSYDSDILSEVHDHDNYQDVVCELHEVHEMHDHVQANCVVDSNAKYTSDSNMIPYDQYVKDNAESVVQNNVSSVPHEVQVTKAANCDEKVLLAECGENLREGGMPSAKCCGILRDQQPCICGYPDHNNWPGLPKICGVATRSYAVKIHDHVSPAKPVPQKNKFDTTTSTQRSNSSNPFEDTMSTEIRLKRKSAESAYEAAKEKDRMVMHLKEMKFLAISTNDLSEDDAYWINSKRTGPPPPSQQSSVSGMYKSNEKPVVEGELNGHANVHVRKNDTINMGSEGKVGTKSMNTHSGGSFKDHVDSMNPPSKPINGVSVLEHFQEFINIGQAMGFGMGGKEKKQWVKSLCHSNDMNFLSLQEIKMTTFDVLVRCCSCLYKLPTLKRNLWSYMSGLIHRWHGEVVAMGDFNKVRFASRRYGFIFHASNAAEFNTFIANSHLIDIPLSGFSFTWSNKHASKMSKLDRFLVSEGLLEIFPNLSGLILHRHIYDHKPMILQESHLDYGPSPLRLLHSWFLEHDFVSVVEDSWINDGVSDSNAMVKWANEGDENFKFFHGIVNKKRRQQAIKDPDWSRVPMEGTFLRCLRPDNSRDLEGEVSDEEIKKAVWDCGSDKSPGPDGFTFEFFKKLWYLIGGDVTNA
nr:RNA-directed DNA polymerase, eukaryota [Tanacetum cinerariifolium]